jgi:hypothetical protein
MNAAAIATLQFALLCAALLSTSARATQSVAIAGIVFDSIANRPLPGASVQLAGADSAVTDQRFTTVSDSLGRFRFPAVPAGRYLIGFYHAALDTLGIEPRGRIVDARSADQNVIVAGPSARTMVQAFCGDSLSPDRATLLLGHLHDAETESAIVNASVRVTWAEARVANRAISVADGSASAPARDDGSFALCGLPSETELSVRGVRGPVTDSATADSSGTVGTRIGRYAVRHLSLYVPRARTREAAPSSMRLSGRVIDAAGRAIAGAQVWLAGTPQRTISNATGVYSLDTLPLGTQSLEVRAIGYAPRTVVVTLLAGVAATTDVTMERAVVLPTVVTLGAKSSKNLATFEAHKRSSTGGFFIKPTRLEGYASLQTLHSLVSGLPGVSVSHPRDEWIASMQRRNTYMGAPTVPCTPQMFLNGAKALLTFGELDEMIDPDDLLGVEVYTRETQIPGIYSLPINQPCGLISIWTRVP